MNTAEQLRNRLWDAREAASFLKVSRSWIYARVERDEMRSEEHTSELQSRVELVCRLLREKKKSDGKCRIAQEDTVQRQPRSLQVLRMTQHVWQGDPDFFFNYTHSTGIYTLSLHDALPI